METTSIRLLDDKVVEIYDDIFSYAVKDNIYDYALNANYKVSRLSSEIPSQAAYPTLKSTVPFNALLNLNFFNKEVLDIIGQHRVRDAYINLGTATDKYFFHSDSVFEQDKTLIYYINLDWESPWKAPTEFTDNSAAAVTEQVDFKPGRIIKFDATVPHRSSFYESKSGVFRYVLVIKLIAPTTPDYKKSIRVQDFISVDSEQYEDFELIHLISKKFRNVKHSDSSLSDHLINCYKISKSLGFEKDVCKAVLLHSVSGTSQYNFSSDFNLNEHLDSETKRLVDMFSKAYPRIEYILQNPENIPENIWLKLVKMEYVNLLEQYPRSGSDLDLIVHLRAILDDKL